MIELNEQQEQEMIDRAKAGDPEANYQMSLWALEQAMAEPEEERWNRLAAKCLVKAAEAGYAPAKEKMDELLAQTADMSDKPGQHEVGVAPAASDAPQNTTPAPSASEPVPHTADTPAAASPAAGAKEALAKAGKAAAAGLAALGTKIKGLFAKSSDGAGAQSAAADGKKAGLFNFSEWDDAKWKKMQKICIAICVVLVILILIMLITRKNKKDAQADEVVTIPAADVIATPVPATPTPKPADYPADDVKAEIAAADLDAHPEDADYVTEPTTRIVSTTGSPLNLRKGTNSSAGWVSSLENGTTVDVYAFKNGWALVKVGNTWGWCSNDYLK